MFDLDLSSSKILLLRMLYDFDRQSTFKDFYQQFCSSWVFFFTMSLLNLTKQNKYKMFQLVL